MLMVGFVVALFPVKKIYLSHCAVGPLSASARRRSSALSSAMQSEGLRQRLTFAWTEHCFLAGIDWNVVLSVEFCLIL
jgi:hypothetical protein